jgi:DNA-binding NarL/FixJ family response regulator
MRGPFVPHSLDAIVAEQDSSQRSLYADLVREQPGYRLVGEVGSGETLLSFLADEPPQLVVLDFALPGLGGLEGFRKARSDYPRLDWVVLVRPEEPDAIRGAIVWVLSTASSAPFFPPVSGQRSRHTARSIENW